ncbi:hypothetical protein IWQ56_003548 [Coemansia nantahalensis]|nr:hypothetical protein IWQ56_003548 [Coemansia nantahalensis]
MDGYLKAVTAELEKKNPKRVAGFKKDSAALLEKICAHFDEYECFTGESQDPHGMVAVLNHREDGVTPYFTFFKDGLKAVKVYYDIDDILAAQERVPCVLRVDLDGLGSAGSGGSSKVHRNARWALPLWMADQLNEEDCVDMGVSPVFSKRANRMYAASPESIQLRAVSQHYYQFGLLLGDLVPEIPGVLRNMYMQRVQRIARVAQQGHSLETLDFAQSLDKTEAAMLRVCQQAQGAITDWHQGKVYALRRALAIQ